MSKPLEGTQTLITREIKYSNYTLVLILYLTSLMINGQLSKVQELLDIFYAVATAFNHGGVQYATFDMQYTT